MSRRKYTHIKLFEKESLKMNEAGKVKREIAKTSGLEKEQVNRAHCVHRAAVLIVPDNVPLYPPQYTSYTR